MRLHLIVAAGFLATVAAIPSLPQSAPNAARMSFVVASVKPSAGDYLQTRPVLSRGRVTWTTDLRYIIGYAYRLTPYRMSGPIPGSNYTYTLEATFDPAATDDDVRQMFQTLLKERFKMISRMETKDVEGYALSVAAGGPKIKEVQPDDKPSALPAWLQRGTSVDDVEGRIFTNLPAPGVHAITARRVSMLQFCEELQRQMGIPVLDQTGLKGNFYFAFRYGQSSETSTVALPALSTAIQEELGLKLTRHRGPVEMLVVEHIERVPTAN